MRIPVDQPYRVTTRFGVPDSYAKFGKHSGIDYAVAKDASVYAPVSGVVTYAKYHKTGGNMLMIQDGNGNQHRLMHNNKLLVSYGQKVKEGQKVAQAGTTGLSTGVHVHWDIASQQFPTSFDQFFNPNTYQDKEEEVKTNREEAIYLWRTVRMKHSPNEKEKVAWTGKDLNSILIKEYNSPEFKKRKTAVQNYDKVLKENAELKKQLANTQPSDPNAVTITKDGLWGVIKNLFGKKG